MNDSVEKTGKSLLITDRSQVTLHFSLALRDGSVVDSNFEAKPASFTMGDGNLLPGFETVLRGLAAGEEKTFVLAPEQAFGTIKEQNMHWLPRHRFDTDMDLQPGLIVSFEDAGKQQRPGVIKEVNEETVVVDFNHPLAGEEIVFQVKIITVRPRDDNDGSVDEDVIEAKP